MDLLICGGGIVGLSIAYQCLQRGWKVALVERGAIGREASWAGAGILPSGATLPALDPIEQLRALAHPLHKEWARKLYELTGIDNEFRECGGIYFARTPAEKATLAANRFWCEEHGIPCESWDHSTFASKLPFLAQATASMTGGDIWWMPNDCRVRNPRYVQALTCAVELLGGKVQTDAPVAGIDMKSGIASGVRLESGERLVADRICVATGAWTPFLLEDLQIQTGILPVRGQIVLYRLEQPLFGCIVNEGHRYLVPRDDGHLLAGSCEEEVGYQPYTTESMIQELKEWAESILPALASARIERTWAGLRPGSFDGYPYLGQAPGIENLFVASGHFRHGLHWSPATAVLMTQLMFGEKPSIDLDPFRILRGLNSK